jgi:hypothetical protein
MIPSYILLKTDSGNRVFWQNGIEICQRLLGKIDFGKNRTQRHKSDRHSENGHPVHKVDIRSERGCPVQKVDIRSLNGHPVHRSDMQSANG